MTLDNYLDIPSEPATRALEPLFAVITDRPMPDFDNKRGRSAYPFESMSVGDCFPAGNASTKGLKSRLYSAIHNRKKNNPSEKYNFEVMDNGDLYVWKVAG